MRLHTSPTGWRSLLVSTLLFTGSWAKKDKPSINSTPFDFIPLDVSYFEDSDVILFADGVGKDIYRSENAGESWDKVEGPPHGKLYEMVMHPFDRERAYYITADLSHWSTSDKGKSWQEFKTDAPASMYRAALTFHAADPDRIIFSAMDCSGLFCEELVGDVRCGLEN